MVHWGTVQDAKLQRLFDLGHPSKLGVSSTDLSKEAVEAARFHHFPEWKYKTFRQTFVRKARAYQLDQELTGARSK